ncbi:MAG: amidohydrolase family protein, partial [Pseudomonadota bacterium]|nr:amidohydrolase family protein [Pseudomonadota bacterium]
MTYTIRYKLCLSATLLLCGVCALAAEPGLVIRAGRLLDVESGEVLKDQSVRISDGKIVAIAPWSTAPVDAVRQLDWSDYTVVPGLMDMHTHIADEGQTADPATPLRSNPARDAFIGARNALDTLRAGFTTVRDVGVYRGFSDVALRDAIAAGLVPGPRMFVAGAYITIPQGGGEITGLPKGMEVPAEFRRGVAATEGEVRERVNHLLDNGAD